MFESGGSPKNHRAQITVPLIFNEKTEQVSKRNPKNMTWKGHRKELSMRIQDVPNNNKNKDSLKVTVEHLGEVIKETRRNVWWRT